MDSKGKLIVITDMALTGSGYYNISSKLCTDLVSAGYEVKVLGLEYKNEEHFYPFAILGAKNIHEIFAMAWNLKMLDPYDAIICALDIPWQKMLIEYFAQHNLVVPWIGIFPLESPPLPTSWSISLVGMKACLCMSKFGTAELAKNGIENSAYIPIGVDQAVWKQVTESEKDRLRKNMGIDDDTFVLLMVGDNQERKNITAAMNIVAKVKTKLAELDGAKKNIKMILVTREHLQVGYLLWDYAQEVGITNDLMIFERGMPKESLWGLYAMSDALINVSKSEGLGLPVLEAMSVGLPVLGINACAVQEHLADGRGLPIKVAYSFRDSFGNGYRYLVDEEDAVEKIVKLLSMTPKALDTMVTKARTYVKQRSSQLAIEAVLNAVQKVQKESKDEQAQ